MLQCINFIIKHIREMLKTAQLSEKEQLFRKLLDDPIFI